jgi:hypothetical protein
MSMSRQSIGPYWANNTSRIIGSGLSYEEQDLLMPYLVDCHQEDRMFRQKVREFFEGLLTHIEYGPDGREFEIGLKDNSKPLSASNLPIDIPDYVRFRHAKGHPYVAASLRDGTGDQGKLFYVHDPLIEEKTQVEESVSKDKAIETYLAIKENGEKVNQMLTLLGVDPRDYSGANAAVQRRTRLRELAEADPDKFDQIYNVDNFELRFKIAGLISTGILEEQAERIYEAKTKTLLANNTNELIKLLQAPEYSDKLAAWMAAYQDIVAKPKASVRRGRVTA